ncbi:SUMO-activating enzyme subunit 2-like [Saccostrea cucullata]|uniref:SUMO-activating enzyme subunit 2-like n=1 Tax=Saccostrea cuccullata TaxID=36930 RepID=UPI002ED33C39
MAASLGVLGETTSKNVLSCKLLVVGAGGIGCELLKNLVLTGFQDIAVIDLDTIDVSNLNRQFLFRKEHVGKSKAQVAKESAMSFNPNAKIVAYHDSIMSSDYGVDFFKKFDMVMNALDNRAARNHVNRMCLAADIPLIESGTAGYLGQVTVIKKGLTECYECQPKPPQKTFPGCTIRNTPSETIHCVVWAKHLFNQLFGEEDPDQDVSPDTEDPELAAEAGQTALTQDKKADVAGGIDRKSTRAWASETGYDAKKIFNKLFRDDIKYLLSMETLWKKRRPPVPLDFDKLPHSESSEPSSVMRDQRVWSMKECADVFTDCLAGLKKEFAKQGKNGMLIWDKDDDLAMDFVASTANIRSHIFGINLKTRFDIKSMAGNIIPAIATTNAIIAALIVMEGLKILNGRIEDCKQIYLNRQPNPRKKLLVPCALDKPSPKCYVCSSKPEVTVVLNTEKITVKTLEDKILKNAIGMVAPDVEIDDGKGTILISSEEGETEENSDKFLSEFHIGNGSILKCDDFLQNYELKVIIAHTEKLEEEKEFDVVGDLSELQAKPEEEKTANHNGATKDQEEEEDDVMVVDDIEAIKTGTKRKADQDPEAIKAKRVKASSDQSDDIVIL